MTFWSYIFIVLIYCLINFISLFLWKIIENKMILKNTEKKIDTIYLKIIHLVQETKKGDKTK